jgi:serine/threonine-protein kinase
MEAEPETKVVPLEPPASGTEADVRQLRRRIGRYEVLQRLGHGGMATVYLARATGSAGFEKLVAIKVIHPHLAAEANLVEMFLDEARIAAQIHNPHVVEILDLGHERGDYYMVMEFVDGETLSALIRALRPEDEHLPLPVVLQILIDACEGLRAAHELRDADGNLFGVIHRDVSPQNLLIDHEGWVRIVDFGIMKAKGKRTDTRTGQLRGKLPYMSPEQAQSRPLTPACDLFALGVILWELCTGQRLFAGENDVETLAKVVACQRPPLAEVRPDLPASLERVLERTLARDPGDRYESAAAMTRDLRRLQRELADRDRDGEPRAKLAAIMRERFGEQAEYRRASTRAGRPKIALVGADAGGAEDEATRRHPAPSAQAGEPVSRPLLTVVPVVAEAEAAAVAAAGSHGSAVGEPVTGSITTSVITGITTVPGRWWGAWIALPMMGALLAIVILVASGLLRTPEESDETGEATAIATVVDDGEVDPGMEIPGQPETIRWVVNSDPDGAQVRISGASSPEVQASLDEQLAGRTTPLDVELPRSEVESLTLEVYMSGYQAKTEKRLPLVTENLRYVLRAVADDGPPPPVRGVRNENGGGLRLSTKPKKKKTEAATSGDPMPLPPPTFDKPLIKKRAPDGE